MSATANTELSANQIDGMDVRIYDNGGKSVDRYTAVYMDEPERQQGLYACVGMDDQPFHPQGFGQHGSAAPGMHLGKRIKFSELPPDCQKLVRHDLNEQIKYMETEAIDRSIRASVVAGKLPSTKRVQLSS